jgi:hypothetical protein
LSVKAEHVIRIKELAAENGAGCSIIGEVGGDQLRVACHGERLIETSVASLEHQWRDALPSHLDQPN